MPISLASILSRAGEIAVYIAAALLCACMFLGAMPISKRTRGFQIARMCMLLAFSCITIPSVALLLLLVARQYQVAYVAAHTSNELPLLYRISAFWAGQEGSMLLWGWFGLLLGVVFSRTVGHFKDESQRDAILLLFAAAQLFVLIALICKSPFEMLHRKPPDGSGLNPLLQSLWMAIHPPLLLLGYASTSTPYALLPAFVKNPYDALTIRLLRVWAIFAWLMLSAGIIVGSYWSYEVGWGGWGWDPVENASFIPWLLLTALLHGLAIQRRSGAMAKTNAVMCIVAFVSVIYATFITRSGILGKASVHVFAEAHGSITVILLTFISTYMLIGFAIIALHWSRMRREKAVPATPTDFAMRCAVSLLILMACVVWLGTSLPLLLKPFGVSISVSPSFFNKSLAPLALALLLLLSIGTRLHAAHGLTNLGVVLVSLTIGLGAALVSMIFCTRNPYHILAIFASVVALIFNGALILHMRKWHRMGGCVAHIGVALTLLGISLSSFGRSQTMKLSDGTTTVELGWHIRCSIDTVNGPTDAEVRLLLSKGAKAKHVHLRIFDSPYGIVRQPGIEVMPLADIYVFPIGLDESRKRTLIALRKGEEKHAGEFKVRFVGFDVGGHAHGTMDSFIVRAVLEVFRQRDGKIFTIAPGLTSHGEGIDETLPDGSATFSIITMNADEKLIRVSIERKVVGSKPYAVVEFSIKPFMNLLRLGSFLILLGGLISLAATALSGSGNRVETRSEMTAR